MLGSGKDGKGRFALRLASAVCVLAFGAVLFAAISGGVSLLPQTGFAPLQAGSLIAADGGNAGRNESAAGAAGDSSDGSSSGEDASSDDDVAVKPPGAKTWGDAGEVDRSFVDGEKGASYASNAILVTCESDVDLPEFARMVEQAGVEPSFAEVLYGDSGTTSVLVEYRGDVDPKRVGETLVANGVAQSAQPDYRYELSHTVDDSYYETDMDATGAPAAWDDVRAEGSVTVAVIDSGVDYSHPDLNENLVASEYAVNVAKESSSGAYSYGADAVMDEQGHGTHVSGIVAAVADNGIGIAGISYNAKVLPVNAYTASIDGLYCSDLVQALDYVVECKTSSDSPEELKNLRVVNMSLGLPVRDEALSAAVARAQDAGLLVCAAMGNEGRPLVNYPAGFDGVVGVGSVSVVDGSYRTRSSFSNYNKNTDLVAPGEGIRSTLPCENGSASYGSRSGTSMATPMVSGAAALVLAANPDLTAEQVEAVLERTSEDLGAAGHDNYYGYGALRVDRAVSLAQHLDMSQVSIASVPDQGFTGAQVKPQLEVSAGVVSLLEGTDYVVTFADNVACGTATATIAGKGCVTGQVSVQFNIVPQDISTLDVSVSDATFTGEPVVPHVSVKGGSGVLVEGKAYSLSYENNVDAGKAMVTLVGCGGNTGLLQREFSIVPVDISEADIGVGAVQYEGEACEPPVSVSWKGRTLQEGVDYTLEYADNQVPGNAMVTIRGIGNFEGSASKGFVICPRSSDLSASTSRSSYSYLGSAVKPSMVVACGDVAYKEGRDYTVSYSNNAKQGTGTATVRGIAPMRFSVQVTFPIVAAKVGEKVVAGGSTYQVTKAGSSPKVSLCSIPAKATSFSVPSKVKVGSLYYRVAGMKASAFKGHKYLKSVKIKYVGSIPSKSFFKCPRLTAVTISTGVSSIGSYAFYKCPKLKTVSVGSDTKTIGTQSFYRCTSLSKLVVGSKVSKIGSKAFYGCKKLKDVYLKSKKLTRSKVGSKAFSGTYPKAKVRCYSKKWSYSSWLPSKGFGRKVRYC